MGMGWVVLGASKLAGWAPLLGMHGLLHHIHSSGMGKLGSLLVHHSTHHSSGMLHHSSSGLLHHSSSSKACLLHQSSLQQFNQQQFKQQQPRTKD